MPIGNAVSRSGVKRKFVASAHIGALTASNILQLLVTLIVTVLLGRSAGPDDLGRLALAMAAASIMQAVSVAGLFSVAVAALLKSENDRSYELRNVFYARAVVVPTIFIIGGLSVSQFPGIGRINPVVLTCFFIGYALGSFDVANISHTAAGRFQTIAWRRIILLLLTSPLLFWFAHAGDLHKVLLLLGVQAMLWQAVLIYGAGLRIEAIYHFKDQWKKALRNLWTLRSLWAASILGSIAQRIDLFVVSAILGVHAAGQYSTASRPVEATTVVAGSLITVLFNGLAASVQDREAHAKSLVKSARSMFGVSLVLTMTLVGIGPALITFLYGEDFTPASNVIGLYALSIVFIFQKRLLDRITVLQRAYVYNLSSSMSTIFFNVFLNIALVPVWGLYGAAAAAVLTHPLSLLTSYCLTRKGRLLLGMAYFSVCFSPARLVRLVDTANKMSSSKA